MAKVQAPTPYQSMVTDPRGNIIKLQFGSTDLILNGPDLRNVTSFVNPNASSTQDSSPMFRLKETIAKAKGKGPSCF